MLTNSNGVNTTGCQFWDMASVLSTVRQLYRGNLQVQDSSAQVCMVELCPVSVPLHLWTTIIFSMSIQVDYLVLVNSLPFDCVSRHIEGGKQMTWQIYIITFFYYGWLHLANGLILSCINKHKI